MRFAQVNHRVAVAVEPDGHIPASDAGISAVISAVAVEVFELPALDGDDGLGVNGRVRFLHLEVVGLRLSYPVDPEDFQPINPVAAQVVALCAVAHLQDMGPHLSVSDVA